MECQIVKRYFMLPERKIFAKYKKVIYFRATTTVRRMKNGQCASIVATIIHFPKWKFSSSPKFYKTILKRARSPNFNRKYGFAVLWPEISLRFLYCFKMKTVFWRWMLAFHGGIKYSYVVAYNRECKSDWELTSLIRISVLAS